MQTVGCVAMLNPRSIKSTMIMLSPLWESHSLHAASHARQPIQREGSTKSVSIDIVRLYLSFTNLYLCGGYFVSPTVYGNIRGAFAAVKFSVACCGSGDMAELTRSRVAAQTLYSGIFTVGSTA